MLRTLSALVAGATICAVSLLSADAQEPKKGEKPEIPGGIEGHVKNVDRDKQTLTITASTGRERTFSVTEDTTMLGPRGGKVRRRLHDPRFHEGMELTIVADGTTAKEIHLGFRHRETKGSTETSKTTASAKIPKRVAKEAAKIAAARTKAGAEEEEDEDDEIPGKVKSYDTSRRTPVLVVALLNGKNESFFLSSEVKVVVKGTTSQQGLKDPALKPDAPVTVFVHPGSRRVRELHINPAAVTKSKKAA
jgi:hypothetical protein